jgi:subfamily B ATP-binding cassette protein MsbA
MWQFLKEYFPYYREYKREFGLALLGMVLISVGSAGTAYLVKPVLDSIFINKQERMLYILPLFVILVYLIKGVGSVLQQYYISYIGEDIVRRIRDRFLHHLIRLDLDFFKNSHSGELVSRVINDINRIQGAVSGDLASLLRESIMALFLLGVVIYQNPKLAFFSLIILPLMVYPILIISRKLKALSKESQRQVGELNRHLNEIFKNIETIKSFNAEEYEYRRFKEYNRQFLKINLKRTKTRALLSPILEVLTAGVAAVVIFVGGREVINGEMTVGAFFSFMTALFMLTDPIRRISVTYSRFQEAIAANERLKEIFKISPKIEWGSRELVQIREGIQFKNVSLKYRDQVAVEGLNLEIKPGEKIGVVGDSGGGKSSFISLLLRLYTPTAGEIFVDRVPIGEFSEESWRRKVAYVPQTIHIFNDTIAANVAYGLEVDPDRVKRALAQANLLKFVEGLPDGIWTKLKEGGSNLSGGQRQRIAIARALYREPELLILDEATSALDNRSEEQIIKTLYSLPITIILVAHRLSTVAPADRLLLFKNGRVICEGKLEELLERCPQFQTLYRGVTSDSSGCSPNRTAPSTGSSSESNPYSLHTKSGS